MLRPHTARHFVFHSKDKSLTVQLALVNPMHIWVNNYRLSLQHIEYPKASTLEKLSTHDTFKYIKA